MDFYKYHQTIFRSWEHASYANYKDAIRETIFYIPEKKLMITISSDISASSTILDNKGINFMNEIVSGRNREISDRTRVEGLPKKISISKDEIEKIVETSNLIQTFQKNQKENNKILTRITTTFNKY